jgi:hypothetical protein
VNWLENRYIQMVVALLVAGLLFLPYELYEVPNLSLDDSWRIALNLAFQKGMVFGKDLVFTGGPLYFLATKTDIGIHRSVLFLFDLFLMSLYAYAFYLFLQRNKDWKVILPTLLMLLLYAKNDVVFKTYYVFLFLILYAVFYENKYALWLSATTSVLLFFIKLNFGLVSIFIVLAAIFYLIYQSIEKKKYIFLLGYFMLFLVSLSLLLHIDLINYILTALPIIDGYNDAMSAMNNLEVMKITISVALVSVGLYFLLIVLNTRKIVKDIRFIFLFGIITLTIYIGFKQQFVRAFGAGISFLSFIPAIIALPYIFIQTTNFKKWWGYTVVAILIINVSVLLWLTVEKHTTIKYSLPYSHQLSAEKYEQLVQERRELLKLPSSFVEKIANKTVDVIPSDVCYIYFNNLNYNPRPIMQSYSVYHEKLQKLNYEKYTSTTAPDKILFAFNSIDDRHPFWDESMVLLSVLQNYKVEDSTCLKIEKSIKEKSPYFNDTLLLLSRENYPPKHYQSIKLKDESIEFGKAITLDTNEALQLLKINLRYSLLGKIRRFLFQPSLLQAELTYTDGTKETFRLILTNATAGILVGRKASNFAESKLFLETKGKGNMPMSSIRIFSHEPYSFQKKYNFVVEKINLVSK